MKPLLYEVIPSDSFLEFAFLRWVLAPACSTDIRDHIQPQHQVEISGRAYRLDYTIEGTSIRLAIELDGFEFHSDRPAFTYDRMRQNDLITEGWQVLRFSYEAIRRDTERCVFQLQALLLSDPLLAEYVERHPFVEIPEMDPDPWASFTPSPRSSMSRIINSYFDTIRNKINLKTLRECQRQAFTALASYYDSGGSNAACVMSVGAGKTALGVLACLGFTRKRALVITPGSVIRGTFDRAFDHQSVGNVLYGLPGGPLIPGCRPPKVLTLDREDGPIRHVDRDALLAADVIVTNFHSLGTGEDADDLLSKLRPEDVDLVVVDEAHIAASDSYQRTFRHFQTAHTLLMSACFARMDGRPIEADVVYRYRLIDSIADGNAKNLRVQRFAPDSEETLYEIVWPDGSREEIHGREALLEVIQDERKVARIAAKSDASIRQVMRAVRKALHLQAELLYPVKPRVLFSALGERHAEQIARIAEEHGIPCGYLHHSMTEARIRSIRDRYEKDSGDLQGIVQLKMLGQGYDFPPITVVVPMRPYGSFGEFYQFIGRGIRVLTHPALTDRVGPAQQYLDIIYHTEMGLDVHIETIYRENDMDPQHSPWSGSGEDDETESGEIPGTRGVDQVSRPDAFVLFQPGSIHQRIVHDEERVNQVRSEREREALMQRYAVYVQSTAEPVPYEEFVKIVRQFSS